MGDDSNKFVTKEEFQDAVDKMIAKMGEIGNKIDNEVTSKLEQGRFSSSLNNIQT